MAWELGYDTRWQHEMPNIFLNMFWEVTAGLSEILELVWHSTCLIAARMGFSNTRKQETHVLNIPYQCCMLITTRETIIKTTNQSFIRHDEMEMRPNRTNHRRLASRKRWVWKNESLHKSFGSPWANKAKINTYYKTVNECVFWPCRHVNLLLGTPRTKIWTFHYL